MFWRSFFVCFDISIYFQHWYRLCYISGNISVMDQISCLLFFSGNQKRSWKVEMHLQAVKQGRCFSKRKIQGRRFERYCVLFFCFVFSLLRSNWELFISFVWFKTRIITVMCNIGLAVHFISSKIVRLYPVEHKKIIYQRSQCFIFKWKSSVVVPINPLLFVWKHWKQIFCRTQKQYFVVLEFDKFDLFNSSATLCQVQYLKATKIYLALLLK